MKIKINILSLFVFAISAGFLFAGPMPAEFRGVIHDLFASHGDFIRTVEMTESGYRARTVSKDPEKAALLQRHVQQMESRLDKGMSVRRWDPAYAEFRDHYEDMNVEIKKIEGGIAVVVSGKTPEAALVAKNHATIISGFIKKGEMEMHTRHAAVLESGKDPDIIAEAAPKCPGEKCKAGEGDKAASRGSGACSSKEGACTGCNEGEKSCCKNGEKKSGGAKTDEVKPGA